MASTAMTGQTDQLSVKPDLTGETKKKRRRRSKKKTTKPATTMADAGNSVATENKKDVNSKAGKETTMSNQNQLEESKKKRRRNRVPDDRYYGRFCCKICRRSWDSAFVFCIGGTKKVKFRQRCKNCTDEGSWVFPHYLRILRCRQCGSSPCECLCEDCGHFKHRRYLYSIHVIDNEDGTQEIVTERKVDENYKYCDCEKHKDIPVGDNIDDRKPHRSDLCEKCLKGIPCSRRKAEDEGQDEDNEP